MLAGRDRVALTEAGRRAVEHARAALRHHDLLRSEVAELGARVTGTLLVASFPSVTASLMPSRLRAFADRYPHVTTRLFEGTDQEVREWLEQGTAEVAVVTRPVAGVDAVALAEDQMVAVLPAEHRLAARSSVSLKALSGERFVLSTGGCEPIIAAAARGAGVSLNVAFEARRSQPCWRWSRQVWESASLPSLRQRRPDAMCLQENKLVDDAFAEPLGDELARRGATSASSEPPRRVRR